MKKIGETATASLLAALIAWRPSYAASFANKNQNAIAAADGSGHLRSLRVTMTTTSARACRSNCIDQNQFFCVSEDFEDGVCCDSSDETCR